MLFCQCIGIHRACFICVCKHGVTAPRPLLDEVSLPEVTRCGLNSPSPDSLTPERAAAMIWTWADGHPYEPYSDLSQPTQLWMMLQDVLHSAFGGANTKVQLAQKLLTLILQEESCELLLLCCLFGCLL